MFDAVCVRSRWGEVAFFALASSWHPPVDSPVTALVRVNAGHPRTPSVAGDLPEIAKNLELRADSEKNDGNSRVCGGEGGFENPSKTDPSKKE